MNFRHRGYTEDCLQSCLDKLQMVNRNDLLKPKSKWLLINLRKFHPDLIPIEMQHTENTEIQSVVSQPKEKVYFVVPYYSNIPNVQQTIRSHIVNEIYKCGDKVVMDILNDWDMQTVFCITQNLQTYLNRK